MKLRYAVALAPLLLAGNAFASNTYVHNFTSMDPNTIETVQCTVTGANDSDLVDGQNNSEMIRGFDKTGRVTLSVADINRFFFVAKHDKDKSGLGNVTFTVRNTNADISCAPYSGSGRDPFQGNWGLS